MLLYKKDEATMPVGLPCVVCYPCCAFFWGCLSKLYSFLYGVTFNQHLYRYYNFCAVMFYASHCCCHTLFCTSDFTVVFFGVTLWHPNPYLAVIFVLFVHYFRECLYLQWVVVRYRVCLKRSVSELTKSLIDSVNFKTGFSCINTALPQNCHPLAVWRKQDLF